MFTIRCYRSGDTAEAETAEAALVAADTLARDWADAPGHGAGALRAARASLEIFERGSYAATLTGLARGGYREDPSAARTRV